MCSIHGYVGDIRVHFHVILARLTCDLRVFARVRLGSHEKRGDIKNTVHAEES